MTETFINLPESIATAISRLLSETNSNLWLKNAEALHSRYMTRIKDETSYLQSEADSMAYLALRVPATYAQIYSALLQIKEALPSLYPTSLTDIGCGPGVGVWAAKAVWPSITKAVCIDTNNHVLKLGEIIQNEAQLPLSVTWKQADLLSQTIIDFEASDIVIIANVLNELKGKEREAFIAKMKKTSHPIIVILEPGNERGFQIIQDLTRLLKDSSSVLVPYINQSFVESQSYWIHFSQRFIRPAFERLVRQSMRESPQMASDWEETKYTYVAVAKNKQPIKAWGRCIGPVKKQKGFLEVPLLTEKEITVIKILKRHKKHYSRAKNLKWGEIIVHLEDIIHSTDL
jgi:ribosomal protein RSM22 (predicted rRNA methylase)